MDEGATERVAELIHKSDPSAVWPWNHSRTDRENYRRWARDVIAAIGLREDEDADFTGGGMVRYVTAWRHST